MAMIIDENIREIINDIAIRAYGDSDADLSRYCESLCLLYGPLFYLFFHGYDAEDPSEFDKLFGNLTLDEIIDDAVACEKVMWNRKHRDLDRCEGFNENGEIICQDAIGLYSGLSYGLVLYSFETGHVFKIGKPMAGVLDFMIRVPQFKEVYDDDLKIRKFVSETLLDFGYIAGDRNVTSLRLMHAVR